MECKPHFPRCAPPPSPPRSTALGPGVIPHIPLRPAFPKGSAPPSENFPLLHMEHPKWPSDFLLTPSRTHFRNLTGHHLTEPGTVSDAAHRQLWPHSPT